MSLDREYPFGVLNWLGFKAENKTIFNLSNLIHSLKGKEMFTMSNVPKSATKGVFKLDAWVNAAVVQLRNYKFSYNF